MKRFSRASGWLRRVVPATLTQIDLPRQASGLVEAMKIVRNIDGIAFIHFDEKDVVRHKLVQMIVKAYDTYTNGGQRQ